MNMGLPAPGIAMGTPGVRFPPPFPSHSSYFPPTSSSVHGYGSTPIHPVVHPTTHSFAGIQGFGAVQDTASQISQPFSSSD